MRSPKIQIFIEPSIEGEVKAHPFANAITDQMLPLTSTAQTLFQDSELHWNDTSKYTIIILPDSWLIESMEPTPEAQKKVHSGMARFVFWNADSHLDFPLPATLIPTESAPSVLAFLLNQLFRAPAWGVQMVLPAGAKVLTERISGEKQIARKIEQSLDFVGLNCSSMSEHSLRFRSALMTCFSAALSGPKKKDAKPTVFQIGVTSEFVTCSLRWSTLTTDFSDWKQPELRWQVIFNDCVASIVQMNPETHETEVILLFDAVADPVHSGQPTAIDILSTQRFGRAKSMPSSTEGIEFDYFEALKEDAPTEFVAALPPPELNAPVDKINPQLELTDLRVEHQKLEKQLKNAQEQLNETTRKMINAIFAERSAANQMKLATSQLEQLKAQTSAQTNKEIDKADLVKKLNHALELIQNLKSSTGAA